MNIESFASQLADGSLGTFVAFGIAFLGGMVAGFGPCVLPMLPAVFGYVTGQVAETPGISPRTAWRKGLALSATFVLGMSLLFASVGAAAALLGRALFVGAWAYYVVAAICLVLGLQMLGVINLPFDALNRFVCFQSGFEFFGDLARIRFFAGLLFDSFGEFKRDGKRGIAEFGFRRNFRRDRFDFDIKFAFRGFNNRFAQIFL